MIGRCNECGAMYDLGSDPPPGPYPCQASIGNIGGVDRPVDAIVGTPLMAHHRTEQGITPLRPCTGTLVVFDDREGEA